MALVRREDTLLQRYRTRFLDRFRARRTDATPAAVSAEQKRHFEENGFLILPGLFPKQDVERLKTHIDELWDRRADQPNIVIDCYIGQPENVRIPFRSVAPDARRHPYKLLDPHLEDATIRDVSSALPLVRVVRDLLGANPLVCNSLLFEWGSQQDAHFDTFFMPSRTKNMMAASWLAIDPVTETNGPLYYYPRSHLIEPYRFSHGKINAILSELETGAAAHIDRIVAEYGLKQERFMPQPGDVLIWHAQLLHGGSPIVNPAETRRSLVTHYWTEIDYPDADQRIDLGDGRWILRRPHQFVENEDVLAEVDAFLATLAVSDEERAAAPETFDARNYLVRHQDVLHARMSPWLHYDRYGREEGRSW